MKMPRLPIFMFLALFPAMGIGDEARKAAEEASFVRFHEDDKGAQLQTGVATYRNAQGVTVDLVGAVHIADKAYYGKLNERFTHYDALLYELVGGPYDKRLKRLQAKVEAAKPSTAPPPQASPTARPSASAGHSEEERVKAIEAYVKQADPATAADLEDQEEVVAAGRLSWLHSMFDTMQSSLALQSQMACVDYTRPNFVHADMSLKQFSEMQTSHNEGFVSLWLRAVKAQWDHPEAVPARQPGVLQILEILSRKDSPVELKRIVGRMFDSVEAIMSGVEGPNGTVIIAERNKIALDVLQKQITAGKKRLGIFYGAAHLKDMEKRLMNLGFKLEKTEWLTAWDLPPEPKPEEK